MLVMQSYSAFGLSKPKAEDCAHLGPLGLRTPVTKVLWGRDFGVVRSVSEALLASFVRLDWPDQRVGRINRKAERGGYDEVRKVCHAS